MTKKRLVVFLVPPQKIVNGGILSIFSLCATSRSFVDIHKSEVMLATYPGFPTYNKNDLFDNNEVVHDFSEILRTTPIESLVIHVPEYASWDVYWSLQLHREWLQAIPALHINILNQNILLMQKPAEIANWFTLTENVTQSTAHNSYSMQKLANDYFTPVAHFSTFVDASQYVNRPYAEKEKLILFSPDEHPERQQIIETLQISLPDYNFQTINDLKYEDYKTLVGRARFILTFGEGFDGYYVEGFFSGSVTLAVYNDEFFPDKQFSSYENTFDSYEHVRKNIVKTLQKIDTEEAYKKIVKQNLNTINKYYSFAAYKANLKKFYQQQYTYYPDPESAKQLIKSIIIDRDATIDRLNDGIKARDKAIKGQSKMIEDRDISIHNLEDRLRFIYSSYSWKAARPLRGIEKVSKKIKRT